MGFKLENLAAKNKRKKEAEANKKVVEAIKKGAACGAFILSHLAAYAGSEHPKAFDMSSPMFVHVG